MTDLVLANKYPGFARTFRRLKGLQRVLATGWHRQGRNPLAVEAWRDSGARREVQDYASAAPLKAASSRRLHRIAESVQLSLPRP